MEPFAGKRGIAIVKVKRSSVPIINDGIDTNAVVITIITLSIGLLRLRAATDPRTMPIIKAITAAKTADSCGSFHSVAY